MYQNVYSDYKSSIRNKENIDDHQKEIMYRVVQEKLPNKLKIKSKKNLTETWPFEVDISVRALYTV